MNRILNRTLNRNTLTAMMTMAMMVDTVHREFAVHSKVLSRCFSCHPQRTVAASHCDPSQEDKDLCTTFGVPLEEEVSTKDLPLNIPGNEYRNPDL